MSEYFKVKYLVSPQYEILVDPDDIEPTPKLRSKFVEYTRHFKDNNNNAMETTAKEIFWKFGSHICTRASLGGWWRMTSHYKSSKKVSTMEMDKAASTAMNEAFSAKATVSGSYGAVSGSASAGVDQKNGKQQAKGEKKLAKDESQDSVTEVLFASKGGQDGLGPEQWRKSLYSNAGWVVTDRDLAGCIGVWTLLPGEENRGIRKKLYQSYYNQFFPYNTLPAGDPDFHNAKDLMLSKVGLTAGSTACAMYGASNPPDADKQGVMDDLCEGEMRCWRKGAVVTYTKGKATASVGCAGKPCCVVIEKKSMNQGATGCLAFSAGTSLKHHELCKTGWCSNVNGQMGVCTCPGNSQPSKSDPNKCVGNVAIDFTVKSTPRCFGYGCKERGGEAIITAGKHSFKSSQEGWLLTAVAGDSLQPVEGFNGKSYGLLSDGGAMISDIQSLPKGTWVLLAVSGGNGVGKLNEPQLVKPGSDCTSDGEEYYRDDMSPSLCYNMAKSRGKNRFQLGWEGKGGYCYTFSSSEQATCEGDYYDVFSVDDVGTFQDFESLTRSVFKEKLRLRDEDAGIRHRETFALIGQIGGDSPPVIDRSGRDCPDFMCHENFDNNLKKFATSNQYAQKSWPQEAAMHSKRWMIKSEAKKHVTPKVR